MKTKQSKIIKKETVAAATTLIEVAKPEGFDFKAGQFVKLSLPDLENKPESTNWRWFSIASAPHETNLTFVYRESDSKFKNNLMLDSVVTISQPLGILYLPNEDSRPIVFLAGGVGIAPIRSLIIQAEYENNLPPTWLFYSNRQIEDAAFLNELKKIKSSNFNFIPAMSRLKPNDPAWAGETGRIDIKMLSRHLPEITKPIYLIVGSPAFTDTLTQILAEAGVSKNNIKLEKFIGL